MYEFTENAEQPRCMPTHAFGARLVLLMACGGFTTHAWQPKGMMCMILGRTPVRAS